MNAILVSVNYTPCLRLSIPWNRHHFDRVLVVTDHANLPEVSDVCAPNRVEVYATESFYARGAHFNKWLALEEGLDVLGRTGWICVMDADVLWPKTAKIPAGTGHWLYTPRRRMCPTVPDKVPPEETWPQYPQYRSEEFAGWTQVFHADDPVLGPPPWYETNWLHAGGSDSFLAKKWPKERQIRPPFECLHLGESGVNWCGVGKREEMARLMRQRRTRPDPKFGRERLS